MAEKESEIDHLEESNDRYEWFVATSTEHDISNLCVGLIRCIIGVSYILKY
ncbi:hypothetical protein [Halovivax limisalsi]|uniref:hypothetical protein n=1 Tax=Halovivax limisalsi TaxID=1453760 RepID=UPI001FFDB30F|nr:hypothetical protein [Halovivax limisalsi]